MKYTSTADSPDGMLNADIYQHFLSELNRYNCCLVDFLIELPFLA
jgi:hypothetical protein